MKTLEEKIEVMKAALDGKEIEYKEPDEKYWKVMESPEFDSWHSGDYRVKPELLEFWVNVYYGGHVPSMAYTDKATAMSAANAANPTTTRTIKVREVVE